MRIMMEEEMKSSAASERTFLSNHKFPHHPSDISELALRLSGTFQQDSSAVLVALSGPENPRMHLFDGGDDVSLALGHLGQLEAFNH